MEIIIKPVVKKDLKVLIKPKDSLSKQFNTERYLDQKKGNSYWLISWYRGKPIGRIQLRLDGSKVLKVKKYLKNCPHIEALGVNEKYKRKGVASKLIKYSEELAKKKGFDQIGLAVEKGNIFLERIYKRRGYKKWKKGMIIEKWFEYDSKGNKKIKEHPCNYFIKQLK